MQGVLDFSLVKPSSTEIGSKERSGTAFIKKSSYFSGNISHKYTNQTALTAPIITIAHSDIVRVGYTAT